MPKAVYNSRGPGKYDPILRRFPANTSARHRRTSMRVFDAAQRAGQAFLIDIAHAPIRQAREQFNGLVILATNLRYDIEAPFWSAAKHRWRAVRFPRPKTC